MAVDFKCPKCKTSLYVIDSRISSSRIDSQWRIRKYGCPNKQCNRRYIGTEVFNPEPYIIKQIPDSFWKLRKGTKHDK